MDRIWKYAGPFTDISILYWVQLLGSRGKEVVGRKSWKLKFEFIKTLQMKYQPWLVSNRTLGRNI